MLTAAGILKTLDDSNKQGDYSFFVELGHAYSYLIDSRINVFCGADDRWAIAVERLGYNPRGGAISLDIFYYGNCLQNLEQYNKQDSNYYSVLPIVRDKFTATTDGEILRPDADYWIVRDKNIPINHHTQEYLDAGIDLREYEPGELPIEAVGRLLITKHADLFRATDEELYKSLPPNLKKILILDEWYHKDYTEMMLPEFSDKQLRATYDLNKELSGSNEYVDYETFEEMIRQSGHETTAYNQQQFDSNRPGSYETWQQIAQVIVTGDPAMYNPTLQPNTHWKHWPDSGSL
ncbi:MAG: hypothetical protein QM781_16910 [Chitinophagaceae bacterium]